ncbi:MAG: trigger factor [Anaerolineae bacterium]
MEEKELKTQEFSNDEVHLIVHRRPACRIEFEVKAQPSLVESAHILAVKSVAKDVTLPGFRKGRAPSELILRNFSHQVDKKWQEVIANLAFQECEQIAKIPPLQKESRVTFKMKSHSLEKGAELTLSFETDPEVPVVDASSIELKKIERPEVSPEKVNETIRQVQLFFAEWQKIPDRQVQEGDFVLLDVDIIEQDPPQKLFSNTRFEVTPHSMAKWMRELVLGKSKEDVIEGKSYLDEDAKPEEHKDFQPKSARITIKDIEQAIPPPLDDHFAQKLGVASLEDLRNSIERLLNTQADAHVQGQMREQVNEYLLSHYKFDLPTSMIEKETNFRMRQLLEDSQFVTYWESMSEDDRRKTVQQIYAQSEKAVRMFYLCRKLIEQAQISVEAKDLPQPPKTPLEALLRPQTELHFQHESEVKQAEAYSRILMEKAQDYLIANAKIV